MTCHNIGVQRIKTPSGRKMCRFHILYISLWFIHIYNRIKEVKVICLFVSGDVCSL